jgi:hypothetical protein
MPRACVQGEVHSKPQLTLMKQLQSKQVVEESAASGKTKNTAIRIYAAYAFPHLHMRF